MRRKSVICAIAGLLNDQILKPLLCIFFFALLYRPEDSLTRAPRMLVSIVNLQNVMHFHKSTSEPRSF